MLGLALARNMGDDAAGRGLATGWAMILAVPLLLAGGLLAWGTWGHQKAAFWVGFALVLSPVAFGAINRGGQALKGVRRAAARAEHGHFADGRLTRLARAIDRADTSEVRALLARGAPDFAARDRYGHTILGHALHRVVEDFYGNARSEPVRLLLEAGAPPRLDVLSAERTAASISAHDAVFHLFAVHSPGALAALELMLAAGADPNRPDEDGRPLYFSTYTTRAALEVLARHGADFRRLDTRPDRTGWTALMSAAHLHSWPEALFFLEQGVPADHVAPDGASLATILAEEDPPDATYYGEDATAHAAFRARLVR